MTDEWYARPVLFSTDMARSVRFYVEVLGFSDAWRHDDDRGLVAAQVERPGSEIILNRRESAGGARLFFSLAAGGSEAVERRAREAGAEVRRGHWGMPVVIVLDPDGNELFFYDDTLGEMDASR